MSTAKLWGGRFSAPTAAFMEQFSASIAVDGRLFRHDIRASQAHVRMLARQGIVTGDEAERIVQGLAQVLDELEQGVLPLRDDLEDIHMHVEHRLHELIGPVAGKLHTARSRNDQVATDLRLYLRDEVDALRGQLRQLHWQVLKLAERELASVMPGFTHMQSAQPVTFGHHLMAWSEMLERDDGRFADLRGRLNQLPLGSAALAGTPYPLDREWVAQQLGFDGLCRNSLDAVADRDFALELAAACAILMTHLSRWSEELILWLSPAFGFIDLPDAFCTGSSIMPQKKNPDAAELTRGKCGRVIGDLMALLTLMKGLPLAYNRDLQEDKEPIFDAVDTVRACLRVYTEMLPGLVVKHQAMAEMARRGFATATDLADYLVGLGIPFREAHHITGRIVARCVEQGVTLETLPVAEMQAIDARIGQEVTGVLTVEASVNARKAPGGTAMETVKRAVFQARLRLMERIVLAL